MTVLQSPWDFQESDTQELTNGFHKYPAMMVPKAVEEVLRQYAEPESLILDPFCGTGRGLLASVCAGHSCVGFDVNPLARLVAKVKLTQLTPLSLEKALSEIGSAYAMEQAVAEPNFFNRDYWYSPEVTSQLARLLIAIGQVCGSDSDTHDFFLVAFSETARDVSWTRKMEFKLYRVTEDFRSRNHYDVMEIFRAKALRNISGMHAFVTAFTIRRGSWSVLDQDARCLSGNMIAADRGRSSVDFIITSPPYGDSRSTVDYGNFSRLSLQWLLNDAGFRARYGVSVEDDVRRLNRKMLGGTSQSEGKITEATRSQVAQLALGDVPRSREVQAFLQDLLLSFGRALSVLRADGHCAIFIADRTVSGKVVRTTDILEDFVLSQGCSLAARHSRRIHGKRLPRLIRAQEGENGQRATMERENILIFRKDA